jgi:nicotinamidase-related amidase
VQKWGYTSVDWGSDGLWVGGKQVSRDNKATPWPYWQQLGEEGWEMVAVVAETVCMGGIPVEKWGGFRSYFKRPKQ